MNCIRWEGAKEYCEWIGGRLPTEEEWEYASTHDGYAHLNQKYAFGNDDKLGEGMSERCIVAQFRLSANAMRPYCLPNETGVSMYEEGTSDVSIHPDGNSPLGLVDMTGNVWEWTSSTDGTSHQIKGGAWNSMIDDLPVIKRDYASDYNYYDNLGFRCAMDPE